MQVHVCMGPEERQKSGLDALLTPTYSFEAGSLSLTLRLAILLGMGDRMGASEPQRSSYL